MNLYMPGTVAKIQIYLTIVQPGLESITGIRIQVKVLFIFAVTFWCPPIFIVALTVPTWS